MIVQISSVAVPQSVVSVQIENMRSRTIPTYQAAEGFVSLCLLQRPFVAYVELLMISIWESEPALNRFTASQLPVDGAERDHDIIRLGVRTYELLVSSESKAQDAQNLFGFVQSSALTLCCPPTSQPLKKTWQDFGGQKDSAILKIR